MGEYSGGGLGSVIAVVSATAPTSPSVNQLWYDTTTELLKRWNGSAWAVEGTGTYASQVAPPTGTAATDTAAIQNVLNAGPTKARLAPGTYVVNPLTFVPGVDIEGAGIGATILQAAAANQPIFVPPGAGAVDGCKYTGFSVKAHATGSAGAAIQTASGVTGQRFCTFDVGYLSNGAGNFAVLFDVQQRSYANSLTFLIENQSGPATCVKANNLGAGVGANPNLQWVSYRVYNNTGIATIVDAGDTTGWHIERWHAESNGPGCVILIPGQGTTLKKGWNESNAPSPIAPSLARSLTPNGCVLDANYWSGGATLTLPAGVTRWSIDPRTNLNLTVSEAAALGTWVASQTLRDKYYMPASALYETVPVSSVGTTQSPGSDTLLLGAIALPAGMPVGHIEFMSGSTAAATPTHWWYGLFDAAGNLLARTADALATAFPANSIVSLPIAQVAGGAAASYATPSEGRYYLGFCMTAATVPSIASGLVPSGRAFALPALSTTEAAVGGTPPAFPFVASFANQISGIPWGAVLL